MNLSAFFTCLAAAGLTVAGIAQKPDPQAYVQRYKDIAIAEMIRTGIPASIKLAQGILESASGTSYLAVHGNNHFGIKCHKGWKGKKIWRKDDDYKNGRLVRSCFRAYKTPEESFIAHSEFLRDPKKKHRYGALFELDPTDYKAWARGLKRAGYATAPNYDKKLIRIIETYNLHQYDLLALQDEVVITPHPPLPELPFEEGERPYPSFPALHQVIVNNDAKLVLARAGETPAYIAERVRVPVHRLLRYNEHLTDPYQTLEAGTPVYIQPKRNFWRGHRKWHYVKAGETMSYISNLYGIKLKKLYWRNRMPQGSEPAIGERIILRGRVAAGQTPRLRDADGQPLPTEDDFFDPAEVITPDEPQLPAQPPATEEPGEELPFPEDPFGDTPPPATDTPQPPAATPTTPATPTPPPAADTQPVYHTVVKGDTLYSIARRYRTTVEAIKRLNGLDSNLIKPGQRLLVRE